VGSASARAPTDWDAVAKAAHDAYRESYGAMPAEWSELDEREKRAWVAACTAGVTSFLYERLAARGGE
jgi:hypothetical protein